MNKNIRKFMLLWAGVAAITFAACKDDDNGGGSEMVDDGAYVVGGATVSETPTANLLMAAGINEVGKVKRDGMFEKYIALEGGKDFWFVLQEGATQTKYGSADLAAADLKTDYEVLSGYRGSVTKDGAAMKVPTSGLYHVILDFNKDGAVGKAQVVVAPCTWGLRGAMNGWGFTLGKPSAFNKESMTFSVDSFNMNKNDEYKFAYIHAWKISLDTLDAVKAETSLGPGLAVGLPDNIKFAQEKGFYSAKLTWKLALGEVKNSFSDSYTKIGDYVYPQFGLRGSICETNWDATLYPATVVENPVNTYTWIIGPSCELAVGQAFKITDGGTWIGVNDATWQGDYAANFEGTNDVVVKTAGIYTFTLVEVNGARTITVAKQ